MKGIISDVVEEKLGRRPEGIEKISGGRVHQTFLLGFDDGELVFQVSEADEEREKSIRRKCEVLSWETDLPIPNLIAGPESFEADTGKRLFFVTEKMQGREVKEDFSDEIAFEAGRMLASFHGLRSFERAAWLSPREDGFELQDFDQGSLREWILEELEKNLEVLEENGFEEITGEIEEFYEDHGQELPEEFSAVLCHGDFAPDNLLAENGDISAILDFDYVYAGHNQRDLVKAANSFLVEGFDAREESTRATEVSQRLKRISGQMRLYTELRRW